VIDAASGSRPDQRVVVEGDQIVWVGPMAEGGPAAERTIDGSDRYLIPGLWDMHVHFLYEPELTDAMAGLFLDYGITGVRDTGGDAEQLAALRDRLRGSDEPAPRIFFAGPLLDGAHVVYDGSTSGQPRLGTSVPTADEARRKVRQLKELGADFIKIYELTSPEVFSALVDEARALELPIASHVPLSLSAHEAGPATDSMEHLRNLELACAANWEELLQQRRATLETFEGRGYDLRRQIHESQRLPAIEAYDAERCDLVLATLSTTTQVPTLRLNTLSLSAPFDDPDWRGGLQRLPASVRERWQTAVETGTATRTNTTFAEWSHFLVGRLNEAGVPIGAGTDTPIGFAVPGESLHRELELLVRSGLSPHEALAAATAEPARFFGRQDEMGQIKTGMLADLVLLAADPLADIRHTRRIEGVLSKGRWLPRP
jgi:imidazolonepropionase-like amidohydrolase